MNRVPATPVRSGEGGVILVDPSVLGQSHLLVNLGIIKLCWELYEHVDVVAEQSHCDALEAYGAGRTGQVTFHPYEAKKELSLRFLASLDRAAPVIFLNLEYQFFLRVMSSRFTRGRIVFWTLHSHFASPPSSLPSWAKFLLRKFLLFQLFRRSRFIVYGSRIRQNLLNALGSSVDAARITDVIHPLGVDQIRPDEPGDGPVRIAFVRGWHAPPPETEAVLAALADISETDDAVEFSVISNVMVQRQDGSRVISSDYRERLSRLATTDLVLYLPTNEYSLQASGALMDSFVSGRPLLGLQTDFQVEIEGLVGPIGFFFERTEHLIKFIMSFAEQNLRCEIEVRRQNLLRGYRTITETAERELGNALAD